MAKYSAFISYSHSADGRFAPSLKAGLQRFAKPWFKLRALKVFLDGANLNLSPHLWSAIEKALGASDHFLYLASPQAAASKWVQQELAWWSTHRPLDKLLIVVTGGELAWDDAAKDFDWSRTDCIPRAMSGQFAGEPFFLDLRWARTAQDLSLQNPRFQQAVALLSATLQGRAVEDLVGEEVEQHRRTTRLRNGVIVTLSGLLLATAVAAYLAVRESAEARRQEQEALRQRDQAVAAALYNRVQLALGSGALAQAVGWVQAGLQRLGGEPAVQQAAMDAATHSGAVLATVRELEGSTPQLEFSPDGRQVLVLADSLQVYSRARLFDLSARELLAFDRVQGARFAAGNQWLLLEEPAGTIADEEADGSTCAQGGSLRLVPLAPAASAPGAAPALPEVAIGLQAISADGQRQLSVCGNFVRWGGPPAPTRRWRLPGVEAAVLSADERWIAAVFPNSTRLLRADTPGGGADGGVQLAGVGPVFAPDGGLLATVEAGHTLLWTLDGQRVARVRGTAPVLGPGGLVVTQDGDASWLWRQGAAPRRLEGTQARVAADGRWVLTTWGEARTRVVAVDGSELAVLEGVAGRFSPAALPGPLVLTATPQGLVRLWDLGRVPVRSPAAAASLWGLAPGELAALAPVSQEGDEPVCNRNMDLVCSADGQTRLATGISLVGSQAQAEWRFLPPGLPAAALRQRGFWERKDLPPHSCPGPLAQPAFAPSGAPAVAIGCADGLLQLLGPEGQLRWERRQDGAVSALALAPDGQRLLTASSQGKLRLWDAATGQPLAELAASVQDVTTVGLGPGAEWAFTLSRQGVLQLWRLQGRSTAPAATIELAGDVIEAARFSLDGQWLLGRSRDGAWQRWLVQPAGLKQQYPWVGEPGAAALQALGLR